MAESRGDMGVEHGVLKSKIRGRDGEYCFFSSWITLSELLSHSHVDSAYVSSPRLYFMLTISTLTLPHGALA